MKLRNRMLKILEEGISIHPKSNKILYNYNLFDQLLQLFKDSVEKAMPKKREGCGCEHCLGFNMALEEVEENLEKEME